jgi:hypothetical protein
MIPPLDPRRDSLEDSMVELEFSGPSVPSSCKGADVVENFRLKLKPLDA